MQQEQAKSSAPPVEQKVIVPTIGRVVWYWPTKADAPYIVGDSPMAAQVCYVWNPRMVNLVVTDHYGGQNARTSVPLKQPGDPVPELPYCEWMPFQTGQAPASSAVQARIAEVERQLGINTGKITVSPTEGPGT